MLQRSMLHVSVSGEGQYCSSTSYEGMVRTVCICILYTTHYHHHTVQIAMRAHMCLCTSVNGLVGIRKTTTSGR